MAGTFEWYLVRTQYISNLKWSILPSRFLFVYSSNTNCCIHIPRYLYFCEIKVYFEVEFISNWAWAFHTVTTTKENRPQEQAWN